MKLNVILLTFILFSFLGCKNSKGLNNESPGKFDFDQLSNLSKTYCNENEILVEGDIAKISRFDQLAVGVPVMGFYQDTGDCSVTGRIRDQFTFNLSMAHFDFTSTTNCVANGSFWSVTGYGISSSDAYIDLKSLDPNLDATININATRDIQAVYARNHSGLRIFKCSPVQNAN